MLTAQFNNPSTNLLRITGSRRLFLKILVLLLSPNSGKVIDVEGRDPMVNKVSKILLFILRISNRTGADRCLHT